MALDDLYQEIILDHYKNPRNQGLVVNASSVVDGKNPFCGDEVKVSIKLVDNKIDEIAFKGAGCAISQASASVMTEHIKGKSVDDTKTIIANFGGLVRGELDDVDEDALEELAAFEGVAEFPTRVKCALLAWNALSKAIEESE